MTINVYNLQNTVKQHDNIIIHTPKSVAEWLLSLGNIILDTCIRNSLFT